MKKNHVHQTDLPPHICQLVDKNNFVIAIKTLAQEQNISLEQAKIQIDNYELQKKSLSNQANENPKTSNLKNWLKSWLS